MTGLTGILIGIGVLVLAALTLFFLRRGEAQYLTDNSPKAVIHNYVLALQNKDFEKAYGYIAEEQGKPEFGRFRDYLATSYESYNRAGLTFDAITEDRETAYVTVAILRNFGGPFNDISRYKETAELLRQNDAWKIRRFASPFWGYDWYENAPKPNN